MTLHPALATLLLALLILPGCSSSDNNGLTAGDDSGSDGGSTGGDTGGGDSGGDTGGGAQQVSALYPASIDDPSTRTLSVARTLNGVSLSDTLFGGREGSLPVVDTDGDGQSDHVFLAPAALVSDCAAGVLLTSATLPSSTLVNADLGSSLRITYGTGRPAGMSRRFRLSVMSMATVPTMSSSATASMLDRNYSMGKAGSRLPQGSLDASDTDFGPVLRRRNETIEVTTPAG